MSLQKSRLVLSALFGIGLAISISASYIFGVLLLLDWGWRAYTNPSDRRWIPSPLDVPIAIFYGWGTAVVLMTGSASFVKSITTQSAFLLYFFLAHGFPRQNFKMLVKWFLIASAVAGVLGVLQALTQGVYLPNENSFRPPDFLEDWPHRIRRLLAQRVGRSVGTRNHPLTYAEGLLIPFFLLLTLLVHRFRTKPFRFSKEGLTVAGFGFVTLGLMLAQGRAVWVGIAAGLLIIAAFISKKSFLGMTLFLVMGVGVLAGFSQSYRERMLSVISSRAGSWGDQQSKSVRLQLWQKGWAKVLERPLTGVGLKGVALVVKDPVTNKDREWGEVHNIFLQTLLERGLVGLGLYLWILFLIVKIILKSPAPWKMGIAGTVAALLIAGLTESWMRDKEVAMIFWAMVGGCELMRLRGSGIDASS